MFDSLFTEPKSRIEKLQLAAVGLLMLVGMAFVYSATMVSESAMAAAWYNQLWVRQIIWYAFGIAAALAVCLVDYRTLARWSLVLYCVSILLLVAVLIPGIGSTHGWGARRWIDFGPFQAQPSEFAKLAFILAQAHFLSRPADELAMPGNFFKALGLIVLPFLLIMKEPDLGSALVLVPTGLAMLFVAGAPRRHLTRLLGVAGVVAALFLVDVLLAPPGWWQIKLENYQRQRLMVYFGVDFTPANATPEQKAKARQTQFDKSHQIRQALISVGSGGLTGKGWHKGTQTALAFLPAGAAHNDFIFSVIAEEKGFVGSMVVLTLYGAVLFAGLRIAGQARDRLGKLIVIGVVTLLFSHVFINIGMNIRIVPVTGIPLPLLSYGGSSVIGSLIAIGLMQNVYYYRKAY
jgi:rod shape determining protein RodA